eukprot:12913149-Ditylum_brightwellii.AAC.1
MVWVNEEDFKEFEESMKQPHDRLEKLLKTVEDVDTNTAYRVNACGALKTLTASKKNRSRLARTWGVVSGLAMVILHKRSTGEERLRCMTALLHLSVPEQNWRIVYCSKGFTQALASGMVDDYPKVRQTACMCLEMLTKLEDNRVSMLHNEHIVEAASRTIGFAQDLYDEVDDYGPWQGDVFVRDRLSDNIGSPSASEIAALKKARLSILRAFLVISKTQPIMDALIRVSGTMEDEVNAVCIATMMN